MRRNSHDLAIDWTAIPYHGKPKKHANELFRSRAKSGTTWFHAYATIVVLTHGLRYTLGILPISRSDPLEEVVRRLLTAARSAGVKPRKLLLDKGFESVRVYQYLHRARVAWVMPVTHAVVRSAIRRAPPRCASWRRPPTANSPPTRFAMISGKK